VDPDCPNFLTRNELNNFCFVARLTGLHRHPSFNNMLCVVSNLSGDLPHRYHFLPFCDGFDHFGFDLKWVKWQSISPFSRQDTDFARISILGISADTTSPFFPDRLHQVAAELRCGRLRILVHDNRNVYLSDSLLFGSPSCSGPMGRPSDVALGDLLSS
jgi:hypothetical protein